MTVGGTMTRPLLSFANDLSLFIPSMQTLGLSLVTKAIQLRSICCTKHIVSFFKDKVHRLPGKNCLAYNIGQRRKRFLTSRVSWGRSRPYSCLHTSLWCAVLHAACSFGFGPWLYLSAHIYSLHSFILWHKVSVQSQEWCLQQTR